MVQALFLVAAILLGACVGSFLNVVIYRLPRHTFLSGGKRSHCPKCGAAIAWYDNIPIFSWAVLLRGKGRCCGNSISVRYPLVEALTAALIGYLFWIRVGHILPVQPSFADWGTFVFQTWFLAVLIACTFIDIDHRILPDVLTKSTMFVGLIGAAVVPGLAGSFETVPPPGDWFGSVLYSGTGMLTGLLLTAGIRSAASHVFGREAMGFGDVKFMGAIGVFVGSEGTLVTFFIGCLLGAVYGGLHQWITKEGQIFFGPFLAAGAAITLFFKSDLVYFVTDVWPTWQAKHAQSPWVIAGIGVVAAGLLLFIIRRGRRNL